MATESKGTSLAVLTSGGDSQGMNAAVRAVVRTALNRGVDTYAIYEGYQGMVDGGERIRRMSWNDVGGILHIGGTVIGSARCDDFRTREGRRRAAFNLVTRGIQHLVVIGGDGSLTGANVFREEWSELLAELVANGDITPQLASANPYLKLVGLVGSIDNDMFGTDMTIGADTALHRIVEAVDAIVMTAASHQRTFVVEVMGRNCGYLALMSALATGAAWVLIPESPPHNDDWEDSMCRALREGRESGRRHNTVIVAEGAQDRHGNPITSDYVKKVLMERLGEDTRVTILGHVQRGGMPSAFDRNLGTQMGYAAVNQVLDAPDDSPPQLIGIRENTLIHSPLMECVKQTKQVAQLIEQQKYDKAMALRGGSFSDAFNTLRTMTRARPRAPQPGQERLQLAVMHAGGPSPGMNTAVRAAVRLALDQGHQVMGIHNGFRGLLKGQVEELGWMSVHGWASKGGAELGTSRKIPTEEEYDRIAEIFAEHSIDGLLMIGGYTGYQAVYELYKHRDRYSAFNIPMICMPASINNNLPGSEHSIGADSALNAIVSDVDKIKQSAVASSRVFVVEVMGRDSGYLALMSGLANGAERVYLPEEGVTLKDLQHDVDELIAGFRSGKRLGLIIRSENADPLYTTDFMCSLFEKESGDLFSVRQTILGHVQQGANPSPFDRIQATRMASRCITKLLEAAHDKPSPALGIGLLSGRVAFSDLGDFPIVMDPNYQRPRRQWWLALRKIARIMAQPAPGGVE